MITRAGTVTIAGRTFTVNQAAVPTPCSYTIAPTSFDWLKGDFGKAYMVRGIPTVMLFKGGQVVEQIVGLADKTEFKKALDKHL